MFRNRPAQLFDLSGRCPLPTVRSSLSTRRHSRLAATRRFGSGARSRTPIQLHKSPLLTWLPLFNRILCNIQNRPRDIWRIEEHFPLTPRETFFLSVERVQPFVDQLACGRALQLDHDVFDSTRTPPDDEMHVIRQYRTLPDHQVGPFGISGKSPSNGSSLKPSELNGWTIERRFRLYTSLVLVGPLRDRSSLGGFCCRTITKQFP